MKRNEKPIIESDKRNHEVLNYDRKSGNGGVFGTLRIAGWMRIRRDMGPQWFPGPSGLTLIPEQNGDQRERPSGFAKHF